VGLQGRGAGLCVCPPVSGLSNSCVFPSVFECGTRGGQFGKDNDDAFSWGYTVPILLYFAPGCMALYALAD
jgi:hypothetical protein